MGSPPGPVLEFQRHECKYLLSAEKALAVYKHVAPYVDPDPHGANSPDHSYTISSLYLDSADHRLLRETKDGIAERFKLRIRSYVDDPAVPLFPEIKKRRGATIQKLRCRIQRGDLATFLANGEVSYPGAREFERGAAAEFRSRSQMLHAAPIVQVGYRRQAYVGIGDPEVRVTFDRDLAACSGVDGTLSLPRDHWTAIAPGRVVLELKFNHHAPSWMGELVQRLGLKRISFSKYANAVEATASSIRWAAGS